MNLFKKSNLIVYRLEIHEMMCGMCESHINDVIRRNFKVKSVKSNHFKNETVICSKEELDIEKVKSVIVSTGYELKEIRKEE